MRKGLHKKVIAGLLTFAVVASGSGIYSMSNGNGASAADEDTTPLNKVLGAEDLADLSYTWSDESNLGEAHEITLSDGKKITVKDNGTMRADKTSQWLADNEMGTGINLGNTLEAVQLLQYKNSVTGTGFDTAWSNPATTREMIDLMHSYGINTIRIPVAWSNGDNDDGTYTIRGALLDRVETVVNYALDNGMYVIINDHWDNQWWGQFGACKRDANGEKVAYEELRAEAMKRYKSYWTQISERFKGYSDHLIFEGANEELGDRLNDSIVVSDTTYGGAKLKGYCKQDNVNLNTEGLEVMGGNLKTDELYAKVNEINQTFVDVVRETGGNNASRHLLIPGYNTNIQETADTRFKMPTDTEENGKDKLFVSVHYYTPSSFCLDNATGTYTKQDQKMLSTYMADLKKFSDEGYGTIIGECGVVNPGGVTGSVTQWFYDTFKEAQKYHAVPVLWDTGAYFYRQGLELNYKDIAIFYNTVNHATGNTDMEKISGGEYIPGAPTLEIPDYLDKTIWGTIGLNAYAFYQAAGTWDYRNAYKPARSLAKDENTWQYIKANGNEVTADTTTVTDVRMTADGKYTVAIDGIDLSSANFFNMLGISTNIDKSVYPDVKVTDVTIKFDGVEQTDAPIELIAKGDATYLTLMAINKWESNKNIIYPLQEVNDAEQLKMPSKSLEISFKISGLDKPLADIESGKWVDPETNKPLKEEPTPTPPSATSKPTPAPVQNLKKGATFTSGNYKYKVTKAVSGNKKGTVTMTGLAKKGKSAKKLSVAATVKDTNKASYTVNAIGKKAFSGAKATTITLNKNIKVIPSQAFAKCKKLTTLNLKAKLKTVSKNAFKGCKKKIKVKGTGKKANVKKLKKTSYKKFK